MPLVYCINLLSWLFLWRRSRRGDEEGHWGVEVGHPRILGKERDGATDHAR